VPPMKRDVSVLLCDEGHGRPAVAVRRNRAIEVSCPTGPGCPGKNPS
jgi:hypothetical protein